MEEKFINVDIGSIANTKKILYEKYNELFSMIDRYKTIIESTKGVYDTESATLYRKNAFEYDELLKEF